MNDADYTSIGKLAIDPRLYQFIEAEVVPGTGIDLQHFWQALEHIVTDFGSRNADLLCVRDALQMQINQWHIDRSGERHDPVAYKAFLQKIGYLVDQPKEPRVDTERVDSEIAAISGPQLVVPLDNARYALNAANARWNSLYDALYGSDLIAEAHGCARTKKYNPIRGQQVISHTRAFLDQHFPLAQGSHSHAVKYHITDGQVIVTSGDGCVSHLLYPEQFVGYNGNIDKLESLLLCHNDLHVDLLFGAGHFIGRHDHAGIYDMHIESAITTIMDCEDSVASVDCEDKISVYRNWLGLMKGTLTKTITTNNTSYERVLASDRTYLDPQGNAITKYGRSLMLVRNVGSHLLTDAVLCDGQPIAETLLDVMVTSLAAMHDFSGKNTLTNSRTGSIYIVKPKMHGPDEVALANDLFDRVEDALGLARHTLKMGIMDEERRTSVNLSACIQSARHRVVFINTGFLDRTGDDIHTNMEAGVVVPKNELKKANWLNAYERSNVRNGLLAGMRGRGQIGKGMWAMPDDMSAMMATKIQHLIAGASTSWVPSPTAATLHAMHYHRFNVRQRQQQLEQHPQVPVEEILDIPLLATDTQLGENEIRYELENNAQSILGYVSRWVGQGIGCSKVSDINNAKLMEDCATLRISSQLMANWLHHRIVSEKQVRTVMEYMAIIVDRQNRDDPHYQPMAPSFETSIPFQAALDLVFKGSKQANGYTEFILYSRRRQMKCH